MNIIFGREQADALKENYTVLEMDTFRFGQDQRLTAFCVVDNIPIANMLKLDSMKKLHENLILEYQKKNWNYCNQAIEHLRGYWGDELDSYYENLQHRVNEYETNDPGEDWDWAIDKSGNIQG